MAKIIGNTTATPVAIPDWNQTDEKKADYIKNKPTLGLLALKDEVAKTDLAADVQEAIYSALQTITAGIGLKATQEDTNVSIDFDEEVVFVFDCGTADMLVAILGETVLV